MEVYKPTLFFYEQIQWHQKNIPEQNYFIFQCFRVSQGTEGLSGLLVVP